jgi:FkbM family methyltransferase
MPEWKLNSLRVTLSRFFNFLYWRTGVKFFRIISNMLIRGLAVKIDDVVLILTNISDLLGQARPDYEKAVFDYVINYVSGEGRGKDQIVFIDVGANIGRYSLFLAKKFPKINVVAIEPDPEAFLALTKGIKINGLNNVIALNVAAFDIDGFVTIYRKRSPSISSIVDKENAFQTVKVVARCLDSIIKELGINQVDIVKIDVEGAELYVLRGFGNSIIKFKPRIIIEIKEFNRKEAFKFFEEVNYVCHHIPELSEYFICVPKSYR